jgi:hypothetical protein
MGGEESRRQMVGISGFTAVRPQHERICIETWSAAAQTIVSGWNLLKPLARLQAFREAMLAYM